VASIPQCPPTSQAGGPGKWRIVRAAPKGTAGSREPVFIDTNQGAKRSQVQLHAMERDDWLFLCIAATLLLTAGGLGVLLFGM